MAIDDVVYHSKARLLFVILGSLMFVALGYFFVGGGVGVVPVIGWLSIIFFGLCGSYAMWRLVRATPAVIVSAEGVVDQATVNAAGLVPWSHICDVRIVSMMNQKYLGIFVHDPVAFIAQNSLGKRASMHTNVRLTGAPVVIPRAGLAVDLPTLEKVIRDRWAAETRP